MYSLRDISEFHENQMILTEMFSIDYYYYYYCLIYRALHIINKYVQVRFTERDKQSNKIIIMRQVKTD